MELGKIEKSIECINISYGATQQAKAKENHKPCDCFSSPFFGRAASASPPQNAPSPAVVARRAPFPRRRRRPRRRPCLQPVPRTRQARDARALRSAAPAWGARRTRSAIGAGPYLLCIVRLADQPQKHLQIVQNIILKFGEMLVVHVVHLY